MRKGAYELYKYKFDPADWWPFWRRLSLAGRKVAVIDIPYDSLCDGMNGLHVVDWGLHNKQSDVAGIFPAEEAEEISRDFGMEDPVGYCDHYGSDVADMSRFKDRLLQRIATKGDMACRYLERGGWDLFLTTFDESHCVGHRAWHLHDPDYPKYDAALAGEVGDPVKAVYMAIDAQIGRLLERVGPETPVILLSGTGMGPNYGANFVLDEILSRLEGNRPSLGRRLMGPARRLYTSLLPSHVRARLRSRVVHVEQSMIATDRARRKAFAVVHNDISGAVRINLVGREPSGRVNPGPELDAFCEQLTRDLMEVKNLETGQPLVQRVVRTSDLYKGDHVADFADLFVIWNKTGPVNRVGSPKTGTINGSFTGTRTGDHTPHGLFAASMAGLVPGHREEAVSILDFAPTVAALLDVDLPDVEGAPVPEIFAASNAAQTIPAE